MDKQDKLLDKVSQKTNVSKADILSLANDLQTKDLKDEQNIREFVNKILRKGGEVYEKIRFLLQFAGRAYCTDTGRTT